MSVAEVAFKLAVSSGEVVKTLFMQGIMVQVNQVRSPFPSFMRDTFVSAGGDRVGLGLRRFVALTFFRGRSKSRQVLNQQGVEVC